ncbi:hypothetical protein CI41S_73970 [Bradyrhizobium ivorense]|nr:hypothetical protein CI41S_73970 [Bradyrhizobium ivorense]
MIVAVVLVELVVAFGCTLVLAVGNPATEVFVAPLTVWLACSVLQLAIHFRPPGRRSRGALVIAIAFMLIASVLLEGVRIFPYFNQVLFVAAVAVLPQLLLGWSSRAVTRGRIVALGVIGLLALPLGYAAWSLASVEPSYDLGLLGADCAAFAQPGCDIAVRSGLGDIERRLAGPRRAPIELGAALQ